jgi:predicted ATPase
MTSARPNLNLEKLKIMPRITAIELENFQSIERRTRIELKPITLLYGPNSAGKSSVFDALQLLQIVLDPSKFDQTQASSMLDRWARRPGQDHWRETSLAVEFPYELEENCEDTLGDFWREEDNWPGGVVKKRAPIFWFDLTYDEAVINRVRGKTVRIELTLKVINEDRTKRCFISEFHIHLDGQLVTKLEKKNEGSEDHFRIIYGDANIVNSAKDPGDRWLTIDDKLEFVAHDLRLKKDGEGHIQSLYSKDGSSLQAHDRVTCNSLSPCFLTPLETTLSGHGPGVAALRELICLNAADIAFYFGAMFGKILRESPQLVNSDRRAPSPEEALTVVDLGLRGWWDDSVFSPSSPAFLFQANIKKINSHFQGLAEVAHSEIILKTADDAFWGGPHAAENIAEVQKHANVLDKVNHHLEKNLFTEKLYRLTAASTLMVPIDLREKNPWGFYALAQPAAVRLFLQDSSGQKIDLHDVGSGVPFVLPVLYAVGKQGVVTVQQPELHLHPALQSSLADVFVEEAHREGFGQFVIETHSEHFLLRLLRRIKSTTKGTCLSDELKLSNEDVSIYYFDPQVEGGTFVTRQLVTPLGDFYNDWPRGFFSERNIDLFDE